MGLDFNRTTASNQTAASSSSSPAYAVSGKIMLTAIAVMLTAVFLILFLHLYLRWTALRRSSPSRHLRRRRRRLAAFVPHPCAARRGLDPAVLESIPVVVFDSAADEVEDAECAVCLSEFEEGEKVRLLPLCGHRFHVDCIDMWFHSHATCPLCRSAVEAPAPSPLPTTRPVAPPPPESPAGPTPDIAGVREEAIGSSSEGSGEAELRIEVPARESGGEEPALKSPASRRLLLRRILSGDLRLCHSGGESTQEPDLEQGEGAACRAPPPPTLPSPSPSPAPPS